MQLTHVVPNLLLLRFLMPAVTSHLANHDAFHPFDRHIDGLSLHLSKPSQSIFTHLCRDMCNPQTLIQNLVPNFIDHAHIHLNLRNSFMSILYSYIFLTGQHSGPYNKTGRTVTQ